MTSLPIKRIALGLFAIAALGTVCLALVPQIPRGGGGGGRRGRDIGDRGGVPMWEVEPKFNKDVFTFVRVKYYDNRGGWGNDWGKWRIDAPDSDNNFSLRLQQMTALKVNPVPIFLELTDTRLFDYPFLYMIEPGSLQFQPEEIKALRRYCLNGGFMMVDDFWGHYEYMNFYEQIKQVFPEREPQELPLEHEIFHCVYDLKEKPQMPSIHSWSPSRPEVTWERDGYDPTTREVHYKAIFDDAGRIMILICHNTDLGDGWEREGENVDYFEQMAVKKAYPMGINIVTYAMSH